MCLRGDQHDVDREFAFLGCRRPYETEIMRLSAEATQRAQNEIIRIAEETERRTADVPPEIAHLVQELAGVAADAMIELPRDELDRLLTLLTDERRDDGEEAFSWRANMPK
jgi:hypothetical protein